MGFGVCILYIYIYVEDFILLLRVYGAIGVGFVHGVSKDLTAVCQGFFNFIDVSSSELDDVRFRVRFLL